MSSLYFTLSNWLNYHKEFGVMAIVIENNRIYYQAYCLIIEYCCPGQELYVTKFTALYSKYKWVFKRLL